jgi:hypothetical protein
MVIRCLLTIICTDVDLLVNDVRLSFRFLDRSFDAVLFALFQRCEPVLITSAAAVRELGAPLLS